MGLNHFKLTGSFILFHMFGTSLCTMTDTKYRLVSSTTRVASTGFMMLSGVSRIGCFVKCTANLACYYVSYEDVHGECILSSWNDSASISVSGWSLFRLHHPGLDIADYVTVGGHRLAISNQRVNKPKAESLCASSGLGRLVEIRSKQMFLDIANYLINLPRSMKDQYGDIWMAGEYIDGSFRFPDGSPLPITAANDDDTDGTSKCMKMKQDVSYKYDDKQCDETFSYMCERI